MSTILKKQFRRPPINKNFNILIACLHSLAAMDDEWSHIWIRLPLYRCYLARQNSQTNSRQYCKGGIISLRVSLISLVLSECFPCFKPLLNTTSYSSMRRFIPKDFSVLQRRERTQETRRT